VVSPPTLPPTVWTAHETISPWKETGCRHSSLLHLQYNAKALHLRERRRVLLTTQIGNPGGRKEKICNHDYRAATSRIKVTFLPISRHSLWFHDYNKQRTAPITTVHQGAVHCVKTPNLLKHQVTIGASILHTLIFWIIKIFDTNDSLNYSCYYSPSSLKQDFTNQQK